MIEEIESKIQDMGDRIQETEHRIQETGRRGRVTQISHSEFWLLAPVD